MTRSVDANLQPHVDFSVHGAPRRLVTRGDPAFTGISCYSNSKRLSDTTELLAFSINQTVRRSVSDRLSGRAIRHAKGTGLRVSPQTGRTGGPPTLGWRW